MQLESLDNQERLAGAIAIASLFEGGTAEEDQATVSMQPSSDCWRSRAHSLWCRPLNS